MPRGSGQVAEDIMVSKYFRKACVGIKWSRRTSRITDPDGSVVFGMAETGG
jgi:hypothetical protein